MIHTLPSLNALRKRYPAQYLGYKEKSWLFFPKINIKLKREHRDDRVLNDAPPVDSEIEETKEK